MPTAIVAVVMLPLSIVLAYEKKERVSTWLPIGVASVLGLGGAFLFRVATVIAAAV